MRGVDPSPVNPLPIEVMHDENRSRMLIDQITDLVRPAPNEGSEFREVFLVIREFRPVFF
jgi:hypothetical protein